MKRGITEQVIALAGVFQAASLVKDVATSGRFDETEFATCLRSILLTEPDSTLAVYGDVAAIRTGLHILVNQFGNASHKRDLDVMRYAVALLHLQRKLSRRPDMLHTIAAGIKRVKKQHEHYALTHTNVVANLAGIYTDTISQLTPRIMVNGQQAYLSNPEHVNRIRALLLAGIRAAVLWAQAGGSRWQILFKRKRMLLQAEQLLVS